MSIGRRVIKNTMFLYVRMLVILIVSLYMTRVLLRQLGAVDYGLNNVVAGVVAMSSFMVGAMSNASTRFFAFALGQDDPGVSRRIFQSTLTIYIGFVVLIVVLAETVGLWFVCNKLTTAGSADYELVCGCHEMTACIVLQIRKRISAALADFLSLNGYGASAEIADEASRCRIESKCRTA